MESRETVGTVPGRRVQWVTACWAGFIAGGFLLFFTGGTPWSSDAHPAVMGRFMEHPSELRTTSGFIIAFIHLALAVAYGVIIVPLTYKMGPTVAILTGGAIGAVLYCFDYWVLSRALGSVFGEREARVVLTHVVFGMLAAGIYKGLAKSRYELPGSAA
jgi:hypothetical protein